MLWHCDDCTTAYAVGLDACPHCGSSARHPQGEPVHVDRGGLPLCPHCREDVEMAKSTVHAGPSNIRDPEAVDREPVVADDVPPADPVGPDPVPEPEPVVAEPEPDPEPETIEVERPRLNSSRAAWVAYVDALGGTDLADYTKAELQELAAELEAGEPVSADLADSTVDGGEGG